jgi:hypothetical protein
LLTAAAGVATQAGAGMLDDDLDTYFASKGAGTCDATSCRKAAPLSLSLCSLGPSAGAALWMDGRQRGLTASRFVVACSGGGEGRGGS